MKAAKSSVRQLAYKYMTKISALFTNLPKPPISKETAFNQYISHPLTRLQIDETLCESDLRILISKITVLESGDVLIRFIDGTEYYQKIL